MELYFPSKENSYKEVQGSLIHLLHQKVNSIIILHDSLLELAADERLKMNFEDTVLNILYGQKLLTISQVCWECLKNLPFLSAHLCKIGISMTLIKTKHINISAIYSNTSLVVCRLDSKQEVRSF